MGLRGDGRLLFGGGRVGWAESQAAATSTIAAKRKAVEGTHPQRARFRRVGSLTRSHDRKDTPRERGQANLVAT